MQALPEEMSVRDRDFLIHITPQKWSKQIMKMTGSKINVLGENHLPNGPVLLVSNHEGDFDIPLLLGFIKKPFGFISKVEVKKVPILSKWMEIMNCVFLDRRDRRQSVRSIREGISHLKQGHSILIFPEGTRSKGGPIGDFKSGSFRLAKEAKVAIVPISIQGTADVFEKNNRLIKPATITLTICNPISYDEYKEKDLSRVAQDVKGIIQTCQTSKKVA